MPENVREWRDRAKSCRTLPLRARGEADRIVLEEVAAELDSEADKIEREIAEVERKRLPKVERGNLWGNG